MQLDYKKALSITEKDINDMIVNGKYDELYDLLFILTWIEPGDNITRSEIDNLCDISLSGVKQMFRMGKYETFINFSEISKAVALNHSGASGKDNYFKLITTVGYLFQDYYQIFSQLDDFFRFTAMNDYPDKAESQDNIISNILVVLMKIEEPNEVRKIIELANNDTSNDKRTFALRAELAKLAVAAGKTKGMIDELEELFRSEEKRGIVLNLVELHISIALYYDNMCDPLKADMSFRKAIELTEENNMLATESEVYRKYADFLKRYGKYEEALLQLDKYIKLIKNNNNKILRLIKIKMDQESKLKKKNDEMESLIESNNQMLEEINFDYLTRIRNRRYIMKHISSLMKLYEDSGDVFSLLIFDIDRFKSINDNYGHLNGDKIIKDVCSRVTEVLSGCCEFARTGGDEFFIVFTGLTYSEAVNYSKEILKCVSATPFEVDDNELTVTFSGGVVDVISNKYKSIGELIKVADERLYMAKTSGRKIVV